MGINWLLFYLHIGQSLMVCRFLLGRAFFTNVFRRNKKNWPTTHRKTEYLLIWMQTYSIYWGIRLKKIQLKKPAHSLIKKERQKKNL